MLVPQDELLQQLTKARSMGIVVGRENIVSAAHLIVNDEAEVWRDIYGMLRVRRRAEENSNSAERSPPAALPARPKDLGGLP